MTTLGHLGERAAIRRLARLVPARPDVRVGIGDDAAVVSVPGHAFDFVLTSDAVIDGIHFLKTDAGERVGHKAIGRALSDLAAMGAEPLWALVNVVAPRALAVNRLEAVYRGAARLARRHRLAIVGGDLARGPRLELHVFAVGRVPRGKAILRSSAQPNDLVYVTGSLGGSRAGKHLDFAPRMAEGQWLRSGRWARAMIDLSDGLATDLAHLLAESGVAAVLESERIPLATAARGGSKARVGLTQALFDGEDFELLFTVAARKRAAFEAAWRRRFRLRCTQVGVIVRGRTGQIHLLDAGGRRTLLQRAGYDHFVR